MYHLHVSQIRKAKGGLTLKNAQYISRTGRFKNRGDVVRELIHFNMPVWAENNWVSYWNEADIGTSRANARSAYTIEMALPKALPPMEQRALILAFVHDLSDLCAGKQTPHAAVPISLAIHEGGGSNPHVHMLISTSIHDGIERSPALWFMRYNSKKPGNGGAKRSRYMAKLKWLFEVREMWASLSNQALKIAGLPPTMDHRSHAARGLIRLPSIHLGPSADHLRRQGKPAPRVKRFLAVRGEAEARFEQLNGIQRTKQKILALEEQEESDRRVRLHWQVDDARSMKVILGRHPFAGNIAVASQSLTVLVAEDSSSIVKPSHATPCIREVFKKFRLELPSSWQVAEDQSGLWLFRPKSDEVIRVCPTHVVSDATDSDALEVILLIAKLLPLHKPVVHAQEVLCQSLLTRISQLKQNWPVRPVADLSSSTPVNTPQRKLRP